MKKQFNERNISMVMDLYEMTMSNGYMQQTDVNTRVAFDVFFRKIPENGGFAIFAGLEQIIDYLEELHFEEDDITYLRTLNLFPENFLDILRNFTFKGDIYAFTEGTIMYPNEPVITVVAPILDAQLVETAILLEFNHQSLIATKTRRIIKAADSSPVLDFGARRAHNVDAAVYGARAAVIGGVKGTATVLAGQMFDIPVSGTMAHSWVMYYGNDFDAFKAYAETYPDNTILLVDTYDVLKSGVPSAIRVAKEVLEPMGKRLKGIRLDSGDLAYLSKKARKMLDAAGLTDCVISASNGLDEYKITSLKNQGAKIGAFGVGENLITSAGAPVFGGVYKLVAVNKDGSFTPRIKISENVEKITNPGLKDVYRIYDEDGKAIADLLTKAGEELDMTHPFRYVDPVKPWKNRYFENCSAKKLQQLVMKDGKRVQELPSVKEIAAFVNEQLSTEIWDEEQRFENPHMHYLDMSPEMYETKMSLLHESRSDDSVE